MRQISCRWFTRRYKRSNYKKVFEFYFFIKNKILFLSDKERTNMFMEIEIGDVIRGGEFEQDSQIGV
jgi:hypothetical protein